MIDLLLKNTAALIDEKFNELLPQTNQEYKSVVEAMRYSFLSGGKRIRPAIMLEFCKLCGQNPNIALNFAVALEMIHTYSLIHDDLPCMDNDDMRRGRPSCHKQFSEDTALLAGDALLTYAFECAAKTTLVKPENIIKAISVLSENAGHSGMIGGQVIDLAIENTSCDIELVEKMYRLKTGKLLCSASVIGCILADADEKKLSAAVEFSQCVGVAFQIIDDILDAIGDEKLLGKPIGSDSKNNKTTFVSKYGIEKAKLIAAHLSERAKQSLSVFEGDTSNLLALTDYLLDRKF